MRPQLFIVGDIHLDGRPNVFLTFLDLLRQRAPGRLIILGDLFDYWLDTDISVRRVAGCLTRLRALEEAGWILDLVRGNREMAAGRRFAVETRCRVHWPELDVQLGARLVRVVHGDRLCYDPGHALLDVHMRSFWMKAWRSAMPGPIAESIARSMRRASRRKHLARRRHPDKGQGIFLDPRRVRVAGRGCDSLIAGHIHECWHRQLGGVDMYLVGDWTATHGSWVAGYADGRLEQVSQDFTRGQAVDRI